MADSGSKKDSSSVGSEGSFVNVASVNMDFVIKIGVNDKGATNYHRLRLGSLVDPSHHGKLSYNNLLEACRARTSVGSKAVEFTYLDVDGDLCVVASTEELMEAVQQFAEAKGCLKLEASFAGDNNKREIRSLQTARTSGTSRIKNTPHSSLPRVATESQIISDGSISSRMLRAMHGPTNAGPDGLEEADPEMVRSHLLNDFQNHLSLHYSPGFFVETPDDEQEGDTEQIFVEFTIKDKLYKSRYFAMDDIYVDLTEYPPLDEVGFAMPVLCLGGIMDQITGCPPPPPPPGCRPPETSMDPVGVAFDPDQPPMVVSCREELDESGNPTGSVVSTQEGPLTQLFRSPEHRHFYRCSGLFEATCVTHSNMAFCYPHKSLDLRLVELVLFEADDDLLKSLKSGDF